MHAEGNRQQTRYPPNPRTAIKELHVADSSRKYSISQLAKLFVGFYGTENFIAVFASAHH
jgi:hypothetical protein